MTGCGDADTEPRFGTQGRSVLPARVEWEAVGGRQLGLGGTIQYPPRPLVVAARYATARTITGSATKSLHPGIPKSGGTSVRAITSDGERPSRRPAYMAPRRDSYLKDARGRRQGSDAQPIPQISDGSSRVHAWNSMRMRRARLAEPAHERTPERAIRGRVSGYSEAVRRLRCLDGVEGRCSRTRRSVRSTRRCSRAGRATARRA